MPKTGGGKPSKPAKPRASRAAPAEDVTCPRCGKVMPARGERGTCPACGLALRFIDAPERPCPDCGAALPMPPGQEAVRCAACGGWQAADPRRPLVARAKCPRCGRDVEVPLDKAEAPCPRCGAALELGPARRDTL